MKAKTTVMIASGAALALWGGVNSRDLFAQAESASQAWVPPVAAPQTGAKTDAVRRAELNARLQVMIADGRGGRLADAPPARHTAPVARRVQNAARSAPSPRAASGAAQVDLVSTITPPAYAPSVGSPIRRSGRYTPPRLDLITPPNVPRDPIACLTQAIYYEARNESEEGQAAVAEVVLNRAGSGRYPRDVCQVVYQRNSRTCQFTFTCDGSIGRSPINMTAWARAERIARGVYAGEAKALLPRSSVNYHANYVRPTWSRRMERVRQIGAHIFYGSPLGDGAPPGAEAPRQASGLLFIKNEAIERAYAVLTGGNTAADKS